MSKPESELSKKLEEIGRRLMGDLTDKELHSLQLQMDTLERWALLAREAEIHDHDNMGDHDHALRAEPVVVFNPAERIGQLKQGSTKSSG